MLHKRPRRNRKSESIRSLVRENQVLANDLIYPLFICEGTQSKIHIDSLPGNYRWSLDFLLVEINSCIQLGLHAFMLFPAIPEQYKDTIASYSYDPDNFYLKAITTIKKQYPNITLISDVAMDPYSSDGHDGLVHHGNILNDESLPILAKMAIAQAEAGIDIIGPSDMMDGRVAYLRSALDENGFENIGIMSYTAKYASAFYGPFRAALESAPKSGDKKTYQMDPANQKEALIEAQEDEFEGADYLMVKPALHYLDIIQLLHQNSKLPIVAYHVSGECAMLSAACERGWLDKSTAVPETLLSIKRSGAQLIITYFAKYFLELTQQ